MLISRRTLGLVGLFLVAVLGVVLWQPASPTNAQEPTPPVAPGSAGGSTPKSKNSAKNKATEDTEVFFTYIHPPIHLNLPVLVGNFAPHELEVWQDTQLSLMKSQFILQKAIKRMANDKKITFPLPDVDWLQERLQVEFQGENLRVEIKGTRHEGKNNAALSYYVETVMKSYLQEVAAHEQIRKDTNQPSPFPTLEEQRSADLAYKLLDLELEPLSEEELARVKAMKFAGGLRVTKEIRRNSHSTALIEYGDLLVGLHVWPTTSLADVKKVLERDDLKDLSPLKFYVIRKVKRRVESQQPQRTDEYGGGYGLSEPAVETVDKLITGRIKVNIDAMKKNLSQSIINAQEEQLRAIVESVEKKTDRYVVLPPSSSSPSNTWPQQTELIPTSPRDRLPMAPTALRAPRLLDRHAHDHVIEPLQAPLPQQPNRSRYSFQSERSVPKSNAPIKTVQVYDGKTFDQWRQNWRRELSSDLRAKAVRAFVAFANAGKDKEAVDEIFAIVAEYDWKRIQNTSNASDPAKNACIGAFTANQMPLDTAVKIIIAKKDSKNARVRDFVRLTLWQLVFTTQEVNDRLREAFPEMKLPKFEEGGFGGGTGGSGGGGGGGGFF